MFVTKHKFLKEESTLSEEQAKYVADIVNKTLMSQATQVYGIKTAEGLVDWQSKKNKSMHTHTALMIGIERMGMLDEDPLQMEPKEVDATRVLQEELEYAKNQLETQEKVINKLRGSSIIKIPPNRSIKNE